MPNCKCGRNLKYQGTFTHVVGGKRNGWYVTLRCENGHITSVEQPRLANLSVG